VAFSENIIKGNFPHMSDRTFLRTMRTVLVSFACVVLVFALNSEASIFKMVENAYKVTLVTAFVPLSAGLFWPRATTQGALCAFVVGLVTWMGLELFGPSDSIWPPQLVGFLLAATGMVVGSLLSQKIGTHKA
jgi:Na+/proline symporter